MTQKRFCLHFSNIYINRWYLQPCYLLDLMVEPSLFETIFSYLDVRSISRLETCCTWLRDMVVQTSIYRDKFRSICRSNAEEERGGERRRKEEVVEADQSKLERSRRFKRKLSEYYYRYLVAIVDIVVQIHKLHD
jgi:hypothetical protein